MTNVSETTEFRVAGAPIADASVAAGPATAGTGNPGNDDSDLEISPISCEEDYELLARWSAAASGALANGCHEYSRPRDFRAVVEEGSVQILIVRSGGQPVGAVTWEPQRTPGNYTVGVIIGARELWGGGHGINAVAEVLEYLFHSKNAHRVQITSAAYNKTMMKAFRSGFIHIEGILRDYYFLDGEYHDAVIGSILRDEYYGRLRAAVTDMVTAAEKDEAYQILRKCLADRPIAVQPRR
jgi:RimJ/RimL family protein N-acetyltransferase